MAKIVHERCECKKFAKNISLFGSNHLTLQNLSGILTEGHNKKTACFQAVLRDS
jgi:hypothetical protein